MKALTLTQPWATLVANGSKRYETRSWKTDFRGQIAIHAAKRYPKGCRLLRMEDVSFFLALEHEPEPLPTGMIIAVAQLTEVWSTNHRGSFPDSEKYEQDFGDFSEDRFAWKLEFVNRLIIPVRCNGALGLWTVPEEIERQVCAQ